MAAGPPSSTDLAYCDAGGCTISIGLAAWTCDRTPFVSSSLWHLIQPGMPPRFQGPSQFSRLTDNGEPPEGMVLADYGQYEEQWGVLTACGRYRPFQRRPAVALATGQHLEIDTAELERKDRLCIRLPARSILAFLPKSLPGNSPPDRRRPSTRVFGRRHQAGAMAGFQ